MSTAPKRNSFPEYVICERLASTSHANGEEYRVHVHPENVLDNNLFSVVVTATAIASARVPNFERVGADERAWAVAYYVLEVLRSEPSMKSRLLSISATANELGDRVWEAMKWSRASLAVRCHRCSELVMLPGGELGPGKKFQPKDLLNVKCSRNHALSVLPEALVYRVSLEG